ncbi:MAG TPA: c-type cytochrome [Anaerolineales bacterium]|nr:c-type cytochrome [Anaerolineales bacterium]
MLQAIAGLWIPFATILLLFFLAFISNTNDKNAASQKKLMLGVSGAAMIAMVAVFAVAAARASSYPPVEEEESVANTISEKIVAGQDLYSVQCVECHGPDGEGGEIHGVEGLDGVYVKPISSQDEMWTRTDETLANIIDFGQQDLGMPPYGVAYGGPLKKSEIDYIVTFMRYTWDSRAEVPADAASAGAIPALAEGEIPSWEVHIQPLTKRYCLSCHREGKENNNYLMSTYQEMITTGDNAGKNLIPGDPDNSYVGLTINGHPILDDAGNEIITQMPPTKLIKEDYIDMLERWIAAGMPETAEEAAALQGDGAGSAESP